MRFDVSTFLSMLCLFNMGLLPLYAQTPPPAVTAVETQMDVPSSAVATTEAEHASAALDENSTEPPQNQPMQFSLVNNGGNCLTCEWIEASGDIMSDTPAAFLAFLQTEHLDDGASAMTIAFHSAGGDLLAAIALGREIRSRGFSTSVAQTVANGDLPESEYKDMRPGKCVDACIFAFLGGRARYVGDSELVLRTYRPPLDEAGTTSGLEVAVRRQQLVDIAYLDAYADEMNFDSALMFVDWQNADSHIFTQDEIAKLRLDFDPDLFGPWQIEPYKNGVVATTRSHDGKNTAMLYCDKRQQFYFRLKGPARADKEMYQTFLNRKGKIVFLGDEINMTAANLDIEKGQLDFRLKLKKHPLPKKINDRPAIYVKNSDSIMQAIFNLRFSDIETMQTAAKTAFRNCLH